MWRAARICIPLIVFASAVPARGQVADSVVDIPTRPGITHRMVVLTPQERKAAVVLLAGGHGDLQITPKVRSSGEGAVFSSGPGSCLRTRAYSSLSSTHHRIANDHPT